MKHAQTKFELKIQENKIYFHLHVTLLTITFNGVVTV